jgi:hypothetical protein
MKIALIAIGLLAATAIVCALAASQSQPGFTGGLFIA